MIYVTGDTHGDDSINKLSNRSFALNAHKTGDIDRPLDGDYVIICGDFGCIWNTHGTAEARSDEYWLNWLNARKFTTLFVDGNHENFSELYHYPCEKWNGGTIHRIRDKVLHLCRGEIFNIDGTTIFTMGGATSSDKDNCVEWESWWADEMPSPDELNNGLFNLMDADWTVDYIITHCAPTHLIPKLNTYNGEDRLTDFHERVYKNAKFKRWYSGHYHTDTDIDDYTCLYNKIIPLGETVKSTST
jgi:hypothetical protein